MAYLDNGGRQLFWVNHRRGGKDLTMMHQTNKMAHQRIGVYWHIYPEFAQARKAIWEGFTKDQKRIMENVFPGFMDPKRDGSIVKRKDEQQMMIELKCGSIWRLLGSDRIEVVGAGPVGVVYSEYAMSDPRARNLIRPMLRENGGWEAYITTPRGQNHAKELFDIASKDPSWYCCSWSLAQTGVWKDWLNKNGRPYRSAQEVIEEEIQAGMPEAIANQEYDCDWNAAVAGSIYGELLTKLEKVGGMTEFNHSFADVFTVWDLGHADDTSIWFYQVKDGGVDLIDYYAEHGKPLSHFFDEVDNKPYRYIKHFLPHDAKQETLASPVSIFNQCIKHWKGMVAIAPELDIENGIQAVRWLLQKGVRFHPRVEQGLACLRQYHYAYDEEKKVYTSKPVHDWSSHAADAFRYLAAAIRTSGVLAKKVEAAQTDPRPWMTDRQPTPLTYSQTLNGMFEEHERRVRARRRY